MSKRVRVILERIELPNPDDKLAAGKLSFSGKVDGNDIGDSALVFQASPGSTIFLAGDKWQKEVECEDGAKIKLKFKGSDSSGLYTDMLKEAEKEAACPSGTAPVTGSLNKEAKGFTLHYRVAACAPEQKKTGTVKSGRETTESKDKTKVAKPPTVEILRDGSPITALNNKALVGELIKLSVKVTGAKSAPTAYRWALTGVIIKKFKGTKTTGKKDDIQPADLTKDKAEFYWVDAADNRTVSCTVTVAGSDYTGTANLDVKQPTCSFTSPVDNVRVTNKRRGKPAGQWYLAFGKDLNTTNKVGIEFKAKVVMPAGFTTAGRWHYVQINDGEHHQIENDNSKWKYVTAGWMLDTTYPYEPAPYDPATGSPGSYATGSAARTNSDSPNAGPLTAGYKKYRLEEKFKMFVMFRPPGAHSIFVPLEVVRWYYKGAATRSGTTWTMDAGSASRNANAAVTTTSFPTWTGNVATLSWQRE